MATWRSGYAEVCKTSYPGSIPGVASTSSPDRLSIMANSQPAFAAQTVSSFSDVLNARAYTPVGRNAWIAVTDVAGSTQAIAQGRYKYVNLAGAAGIAAFSNAFPGLDLPFAFGGDGAAILVPDGTQIRARAILASLQAAAQSALGLTLRAALVPMSVICANGLDVQLVYQELANGRRLPMLSGGGISFAESLAKSPQGQAFWVAPNSTVEPPNLDGLSCRWQPVKPQRGLMLSVLVAGPSKPDAYLPVFDAIAVAAAGPQSPLARAPLPAWPPKGLRAETRLRVGRSDLRYMASILGQSALGAVSAYTGWTIGGFNGQHYRASLLRHCDALKFADGLKMVVDCSVTEADAVEAALNALPAESGFGFGLQRSDSALMTCFVQTTADGGHIHFIDGAQGGYAIAAQSLKTAKQPPLTSG